jgi:drug/metabolite transporter (DMT)-like permease
VLGVLFSMLAAATFAFNATAARRAVLSATVTQGMLITVPLGVPLSFLIAAAFGQASQILHFSAEALIWLGLAGIVHFVAGRFGNYRASQAIGTNLSSNVIQGDILVSLLLAISLLGETITPLRALGIALVLLGPALAYRRRELSLVVSPKPVGAAVSFTPKYAEGYLFAALAAVCYGISPVLVGLGLRGLEKGSGGLAGVVVSYSAATLALVGVVLVTGQWRQAQTIDAKARRWFMSAGVFVLLSHVFRYAAISLMPVSIVTTLQRLSTIFRFHFGWILNRDHEVYEPRVYLATVVSLIGAFALSISTDLFLSLAPWPDWLVRAVRLQWP